MRIHVSFLISVFVVVVVVFFPGYIPWKRNAELYGSSTFGFFKEPPYQFLSWPQKFPFLKECSNVPFSPDPFQHVVLEDFLMIFILTSIRVCLIVI